MSNGDNPYWDSLWNAWILHSESSNCQRTETEFLPGIGVELQDFIDWMDDQELPRYIVGGSECNLPGGGGGCHNTGSYHCCGGAVDFGQLSASEISAIDAKAQSQGYGTQTYTTSIHVTFEECILQE
jgi:hypothetical protein